MPKPLFKVPEFSFSNIHIYNSIADKKKQHKKPKQNKNALEFTLSAFTLKLCLQIIYSSIVDTKFVLSKSWKLYAVYTLLVIFIFDIKTKCSNDSCRRPNIVYATLRMTVSTNLFSIRYFYFYFYFFIFICIFILNLIFILLIF